MQNPRAFIANLTQQPAPKACCPLPNPAGHVAPSSVPTRHHLLLTKRKIIAKLTSQGTVFTIYLFIIYPIER